MLFISVWMVIFQKCHVCVQSKGFSKTPSRVGLTKLSKLSGKKRPINLRKILGKPAGCPWDSRRDIQCTGRCSRDFLFFFFLILKKKLTFLPGHRPGVPGTPSCPRGFQKFYVIFSFVPFLSLKIFFVCWGLGKKHSTATIQQDTKEYLNQRGT